MADRESTGEVRRERGEVDRRERGLDAARFDAREVEERVHQLEQPLRVALRDLEMYAQARRRLAIGERVLERPEHERERRTELVADVREEDRLGAIDLGQSLGAAPLLVVRPRVRNGSLQLGAHQSQEAAVAVVQPDAGADADHQGPGRTTRHGGLERHDCRHVGRICPGPGRHGGKNGSEVVANLHRLARECRCERPWDVAHRRIAEGLC